MFYTDFWDSDYWSPVAGYWVSDDAPPLPTTASEGLAAILLAAGIANVFVDAAQAGASYPQLLIKEYPQLTFHSAGYSRSKYKISVYIRSNDRETAASAEAAVILAINVWPSPTVILSHCGVLQDLRLCHGPKAEIGVARQRTVGLSHTREIVFEGVVRRPRFN